ncbi:hypothetical protein PAMC26510_37195 [Caballeronia sordidicola]|uniref:Uncharacterized protein n=1 Tax=Caballeronia sordidicola TaxID=196367 RepID=A0A242M3W6_CABSO|nr:hypothetical protein PAMC26510_37195 [Caballeronia sordidicola]
MFPFSMNLSRETYCVTRVGRTRVAGGPEALARRRFDAW